MRCVCGLTAAMSDVPPKKDPLAEIMANAVPVCPPNDPWYTAALYEAWLEHVDESEPLWRVPYFGQVVRRGTAKAIFADRKHEHETNAAKENKDLGFHAVIDMFGTDALEWRIVSSSSGPRTAMLEWANAEEIRLIEENGGVLRNMDAKLVQTLNLTEGGQGDAAGRWASIDAMRRRKLNNFKAVMETYVADYGSALVPQTFVMEDGYPLGKQLLAFRQGVMCKGLPEEAEIVAWAMALPKWAWNAKETKEWRERISRSTQHRWNNASKEKRTEWSKINQKAQRHAKVHAKHVQDGQDQFKREEKNDPGYRSRRVKAQQLRARRQELERARKVAIPFEKSQKRRAEMRATSEDYTGLRKNRLLYMKANDGSVIYRVTKQGDLSARNIVGPVVDPVPPDDFESESD